MATLISVSPYRGDRQNPAISVGLWAPAILNPGKTLVDDPS